MSRCWRALAAVLVLGASAGLIRAQDVIGPGDWPTIYRTPANTVSTPVAMPDPVNFLWAQPAGSGHILVSGGKVISGGFVYNAWSGEGGPRLPDAGNAGAITAGVYLTVRNSHEFFAYDISTLQPLWSLDSLSPGDALTFNSGTTLISAYQGVFYASGYYSRDPSRWHEVPSYAGVAAIEAETGTVLWQTMAGVKSVNVGSGPPYAAIAEVLVPQEGGNEVVVYTAQGQTFNAPTRLVALRATDGAVLWSQPGYILDQPTCHYLPSVDPAEGLVYCGVDSVYLSSDYPHYLRAYDAATGDLVWEGEIDTLLNGPPTLGDVTVQSGDGESTVRPAVFAVTGGGDGTTAVYAFQRRQTVAPGTERLLWLNPAVPTISDAYCSATFAAGRLYIEEYGMGPGTGRTFVLDANTGQVLQVVPTTSGGGWERSARVIVEVPDGTGAPHSVMYCLDPVGYIQAWSPEGTQPPPVPVLSLQASPNPIRTGSSSQVTATLTAGGQPVDGKTVAFACDAAKNQGFLSPTSAVTVGGRATVTFYSQSRTGVVVVTASAEHAAPVSIAITVDSSVEPPPATGSVSGTVKDATGKVVRGAAVEAVSPEGGEGTATTNAKGTYTISGLTKGTYTVTASKDGKTGTLSGVSVIAGATTTGADLVLSP